MKCKPSKVHFNLTRTSLQETAHSSTEDPLRWTMPASTTASGTMRTRERVKEPKSGRTVPSILATGRTTKLMEKEELFKPMETSTRVSGELTRPMAMASTNT